MLQTFSFQFKSISTYRAELMGLAAIGILMCHAAPNGVHLPAFVMQLFGLGQIGVSLFFFLSGLGLYFSLSSSPDRQVRSWYRKRFVRILIPYSLIYAPALLLECIQTGHTGWYYIYKFSTIAYWFGDGGCWFIALIVPFYLIAPVWKRCLDRVKYSVVPTVILVGGLLWVDAAVAYPGPGVFSQGVFFFLGMWLAPYVMGNKSLNIRWLFFVIVVMIILLFLYYTITVCPLFWILFFPMLIAVCMLFEVIGNGLITSFLRFMGRISLESYLFNVTLILWIDTFRLIPESLYSYRYAFMVVFGTILSYLFNRLGKLVHSVSV